VRRLAPLALASAALAGCGGGGGNDAVAHVGGAAVTQKQLDAVVRHFRDEAAREGKSFPQDGSRELRQIRNRLLGLLVYRTELAQAAHRLGITVSEDEVSRRLAGSAGGEEQDQHGDTFPRETVETQLLNEAIFRRVTRDVTAPTPAELGAKRNRAMSEFITRLQRETNVRYEPGYAPGP
jgi:SurA N-terminal domain